MVTSRLTTEGRLVLQQQSPDSTTDVVKLDQPISSTSMLDSGNFVLYGSNQENIWQSFDHPTDTILPGILSKDQELISSRSESDYFSGIFKLKMQSDGNLVQHPVDAPDTSQHANWDSQTVADAVNGVNHNLK